MSNKKKHQHQGISRRFFLQGAAIGTAVGGANLLSSSKADATTDSYYPATNSPSAEYDCLENSGINGGNPRCKITPGFRFTNSSGALQPDTIVNSACQFCNSLCRLKVHLKQGRIIDVVGETEDPVQAGGLCVKDPMMTQLVYNRFRLTRPMKRVAGAKGSPDSKFEAISWDEALETIAAKFLALRDANEARAIANKTSGRLPRGTGSLVERFFTLLGSPNNTDVSPVCNDAGGNALAWTFGLGNFTNGYGKDGATGKEDLGSAKFFLFLGTNQAETHPVTVEIYTLELDKNLATAGHSALPIFYTHPEVTGKNPTIEYIQQFVSNPVNPQALTRKVKLGKVSSGENKEYPLMGMIGRPSVVHFHTVTHWTYTGKQMNGIRLIQIHPKAAAAAGIKNGMAIAQESPRGSITGSAQIWQGIREDTIFVPHTFGPMQKMAEELGTPYYEAANNLLDDKYYDNLSGQQAYKCFACRVKKV